MSLLKRTTATVQRSRWLIIAGILMLMVPCLAAAAFAFRFDVGAFGSSTGWQEPSAREKQERETRERNQDRTVEELKEALAKENNPEVRAKLEASIKRHMVERATRERQFTELRERIENEQNPQVKAELQAKMQAMKEELANGTNEGWVRESAGLEQKARELKQRIETETNESTRAELIAQLKALEERQTTRTYSFTVTEKGSSERREQEEAARQARQAELARHDKISMDQAIQIANGQYPGKVLECSLNGEHWEAPGKLAKDGYVFYHVVILSNDAANPTNQHILVNAEDGRILKAGRERP